MSVTMDDPIKRWTAKRKTALVVEIIQGACEGPWRRCAAQARTRTLVETGRLMEHLINAFGCAAMVA
ncbi:hypothetical protein DWF04_021030 [Cereibacter sphaeroides f. sp. denitrificans]